MVESASEAGEAEPEDTGVPLYTSPTPAKNSVLTELIR